MPDAAADVPVLELAGLSRSFGSLKALSKVSLSINAGEVHCLLGENGAGKSTLCNLIFGLHDPDEGEMLLAGAPFRPAGPAECFERGIAMVHQHFSLMGTMTVTENLMLGQTRGRLPYSNFARRIRELSAEFGLQVNPDSLVENLSVGEKQRVEILKCVMRLPRLLILDEPTAVLPPTEIDALLGICRRFADAGCGVLLVTHKLAEVARIADRITVLRHGRVVASAAAATVDLRDMVTAMIGRDLGSVDRAAVAALVEKEGAEAPPSEVASKQRYKRTDALMVDGLAFVDAAGAARLREVTFTVAPCEIVGLAGVAGNGQTELGMILAGLAKPTDGRVFIGGKDVTGLHPGALTVAGLGVVPEDRHAVGTILPMSIAENLFMGRLDAFSRFGFVDRGGMAADAATVIREHDIRATGPAATVASLSGGNQQKVVLARELALDPLHILVAAEPTRGLDVGAVETVYARLRTARDNGAGVLLISTELDDLIAIADRILVIYRGQIVGQVRPGQDSRSIIGGLMSGHDIEGHLSPHKPAGRLSIVRT